MGKRITLILSMAWLACFLLMAAEWLPRTQLYFFPLNLYGSLTSRLASYEVWPSASTNPSSLTDNNSITVVPPWSSIPYENLLRSADNTAERTLVVCSGLDGYMVTHYAEADQWGMLKRVVVFDGGHHLPTLATSPQLLLVPVSGRGYAAHAYMHDGIAIEVIKAIIKELEVPTRIVTAGRWSVVKCEWGLYGWAHRLEPYAGTAMKSSQPTVITGPHYAICNQLALAYVVDDRQARELFFQLKKNRTNYQKIYLAFNYSQVQWKQASLIAEQWSSELLLPVKIVNEDRTAVSSIR